MIRLLPVCIFALFGVVDTFAQSTSENQNPGWLVGSWKMDKKNGTLVESWTRINDSSYEGSSFILPTTGEKRILETLQLVRKSQTWYYISTVENQNNKQPVSFKLTAIHSNGFTAENPLHDFPKRIRYTKVNADSIHAVIDGGPDAPSKKSDFYYSRKKS